MRVASLRREGRQRCQSSEWKPSPDVSMLTACNEVSCKVSWTAWSQSTASSPIGPARLCKASNSNQKLSLDRHHNIAWASMLSTGVGGGGGVAGSVMFRLGSWIANLSRWQVYSWAFTHAKSNDLKFRLLIKISCHSWLERGGAVDDSNQWMHAGSIACQVRKYLACCTALAPRKMPGSGKTYLWSFADWYLSSTHRRRQPGQWTRQGLTAGQLKGQWLTGIYFAHDCGAIERNL